MKESISRRRFLATNGPKLTVSLMSISMLFSGCQTYVPASEPYHSLHALLLRMLPEISHINITSNFGYRTHPSTGKNHFHQGIDIALKPGTAIHAPGWGFVHDIFHHPKSGLSMLFVDLSNHVTWGLAHLQEVITDAGTERYQGAPLAASGGERGHPNSGNSSGPHLHLTARVNGELVDPFKIL